MTITIETIDNHMNNLIIPYTAFKKAIYTMDQKFTRACNSNKAAGFTLLGPSGSGKTTALKHFAGLHPSERTESGLIKPVIMVTVPPNPTTRELASVLLNSLGAQEGSSRETEASKTRQLVTLIKNCEVKMIVFEEFQHFVIRGDKRLYQAADWLKVLLDEAEITAVISGLPEAREVLDKNEQLARRFSSNLSMPRFSWEKQSDQIEFLGILKAFETGLNDFAFPELSSSEVAFRFYLGTGGLISNVKKILQEAIYNCLKYKVMQVTLDDLASAWDQVIKHPLHGNFNPFLTNVNNDCMPELLSFANSIGVPSIGGRVKS